MAEKKVVRVESTKKETKKTGFNIDINELKKIGSAILAFVISNPEIVSKLLERPAAYLKKIVNKEDVSKDTKKKVNKTINDNKSGGIGSILSSLGSLAGGNSDVSDIFGDISRKVTKARAGKAIGNIVGDLLDNNSKSKRSKKTTSSSGLGSFLRSLFK